MSDPVFNLPELYTFEEAASLFASAKLSIVGTFPVIRWALPKGYHNIVILKDSVQNQPLLKIGN